MAVFLVYTFSRLPKANRPLDLMTYLILTMLSQGAQAYTVPCHSCQSLADERSQKGSPVVSRFFGQLLNPLTPSPILHALQNKQTKNKKQICPEHLRTPQRTSSNRSCGTWRLRCEALVGVLLLSRNRCESPLFLFLLLWIFLVSQASCSRSGGFTFVSLNS